ncbi:Cloroperoxidase [Trichoderma citrinoviride]|uniref:Cloroperoxidase n=1 Tax=Trichoderma citrinoviride TaxID=58853 RepID=A0A2T4B244_9HYPO|nr:Cloroperoxidase [Trichoderma citrinoviride]PTB63392.1 Cloroperoxidase [Trichoderma citrinoviride]
MYLWISLLSLTTLATAACAGSRFPRPQIQPWVPPGPDDSRGPCPMLNTLANHGYLPHHGHNITASQIENAFTRFLNVEAGFADPARDFAKAFGHDVFNLVDLNTPGIIQHITSLTRDDYTPEEPHLKADPLRIERLLADSDTPFLTVDSIAKSRLRLIKESEPRVLPDNQVTFTLFEAAMTLTMMSDDSPDADFHPPPSAYKGPKDRIRTWFEEERFPTEFGWKPSRRTIKLADMNPAIDAIVKSMEKQDKTSHIPMKFHS